MGDLKRLGVLVCATLGLLGCFLPMAGGPSWFGLRGGGSLGVIAAYALPIPVALRGAGARQAGAVIVTASFGYLLYELGHDAIALLLHGGMGGVLMSAGALGGFAAATLALVDSLRTRR